jgi:hypothetical protein
MRRNKVYEEVNFDRWKNQKGTINTAIKAKITNFAWTTIIKTTQDYFRHLDEQDAEHTADDKYFLANYENSELFQVDEILAVFREKQRNVSVEVVTQSLGKVNLNVTINIDHLEGIEEDLEEWFENFERIAASNGWNKDIMGMKVPCYLKDSALLIWQNVDPKSKNDYDLIKRTILNRLKNEDSLEQAFYNRKQKENETSIEYGLRLEKLSKRAFPRQDKEKETVKVFLKGLHDEIRKYVLFAKIETMEEAIEITKKVEDYAKTTPKEIQAVSKELSEEGDRGEVKKERESRYTQREISPGRYSYRGWDSNRQNRSFGGNNYERSDYRHKNREGYRSKSRDTGLRSFTKCYSCGQMGHMARYCRANRSKSPDSRQVTCYRCHKTGHIAAKCHLNSKN